MNRTERRRQQRLARKGAKAAGGVPAGGLQGLIRKGTQLHQAGRLSEAEEIYGQVIGLDPDHADANHLMGLIAHHSGKHDLAVELISKAIRRNPEFADFHFNLGIVLQELQRSEEAAASYRKAVAFRPDYVEAHGNLGNALRDLGQLEAAAASYRKLLTIAPNVAEAHSNLGVVLQELRQPEEAVASYKKALALDPGSAETCCNLGNALRELGQLAEAVASYMAAISLNPQTDAFWDRLAACLETVSFTSADDNLFQILLRLLERPTVRPRYVARAVVSAVRHQSDFSQLLALTSSDEADGIAYANAAERLSAIPLLLRIMDLCPISDPEVEAMFTCLRRILLGETAAGRTGGKGLPFNAALALHCFTNEYVYFETAEEAATVERLQQQAAALVTGGREVPPALVCALGAYRPLHGFPWAEKLLDREWSDDVRKVIVRQVAEPLEERALRDRIPRLTPISHGVSRAVRDQYEENPYPRWIRTGLDSKARSIGEVLQNLALDHKLEDYTSPGSPEILVAGCGTGQNALMTASRFSNAHVLAVDISLSSLAYAIRKTRELGVSNIEYAQADIMELGSLGRRFDLVESSGVLHHLADPLAGWRVLLDLLRPGGLMNIGLYSAFARQDVVKARALIDRQGYAASPEAIRRFRKDIMSADGRSEFSGIIASRNFFSLSECRDFLFHVQEHRFTLPQVEAALGELGLTFLGFEIRDREVIRDFRKACPDPDAARSLSLWHRFEQENPGSFKGMYQFWCRKT